jgi:pimeloyl-ACP methyl ester carboxylesterase
VIGSEALIKHTARDFFDPKLVQHFIGQYRVQMQYKGFQSSILSSIRSGMLDGFIHIYQTLGKMDKPILLLWGRNDATVPFEHSQKLREVLPAIEFHVIENCGHIPHYERPEEVNPLLLEFLRQT